MLNGHASESDYSALMEKHDRFFIPVADQIYVFASAHGLLLEKYYHDDPVWSLRFAHPVRGQATIDISRTEDDTLSVSATWWVDDFDTFTRSLRDLEPTIVQTSNSDLANCLDSCLRSVLSWDMNEWTRVATGYKGIWDKVWTRNSFEALAKQWPLPR